MAELAQRLLEVRLQGLDEKANPRTAVEGVIVDGRNWMMDKDGRISKRPGSLALDMDAEATDDPITGARELAALGDELFLHDGIDLYARNPMTGKWIERGRVAYERLDIIPGIATRAECNGRDSRLHLDSAAIGRYVLTVMEGGAADGDATESGWILTDKTTGEILASRNTYSYVGVSIGTNGAASPAEIFVGWAMDGAKIKAGVWASNHRSVSWVDIVTDAQVAYDHNAYSLDVSAKQAATYAVVRVAADVWLLAYQTPASPGADLVIRKVTRTTGDTFTVSDATFVASVGISPIVPAWAYAAGAATAKLAAVIAPYTYPILQWATITISTMVASGAANKTPDAWQGGGTGWEAYAATGVASDDAYFVFDVLPGTGADISRRSVWFWAVGDDDATLLVRDACLLTHLFTPPGAVDTGECALGVAVRSTWQPSSFLLRVVMLGGFLDRVSLGAHLQPGDFAGAEMGAQRPHGTGGLVPLGTLTNPISLGGPGTVTLAFAQLVSPTHVTCSQPAEIGGVSVLPGAMLKAYDGQHVTEAAFALGPEAVEAVESAIGATYYVTSATGVLSASKPRSDGSDLLASFSGPVAELQFETPVGVPGKASWPVGTVTMDLWVRIVGPTSGYSYTLSGGAAESALVATSETSFTYQSSWPTPVALNTSETWQNIRMAVTAPAISGATAADRLIWKIRANSTLLTGDTAELHVAFGGAMATKIETPLPILETGTRQYCACAVWTDSKGRIQRSQVCPVVALTTVVGRSTKTTLRMLHLTERDGGTNFDAQIRPAEIELYRTMINSPIFYRVGSVKNVANGDDVDFYDATPDAEITANEQLYTTGGVVQNWPPRGCHLVCSHQGRVFVATADNKVLFSAYTAEGEGLAFASEYQVEVSHVPGRFTALLSLDDKLIVGTATAMAPVVGIGPEAIGSPAYDTPMLIGSGIGPSSQRACARLPDGFLMITAHGAYVVNRGLGFEWCPQVDVDVPGSSVWYAAVYEPTGGQARLSTTGLVVVCDFTVQPPPGRSSQWFRWTYASDVVAYASIGSTLYQLCANGTVYQADVGAAGAYADGVTSYQQWIQFAVLSPAGRNAWSRVYQLRVTGDLVLSATLKIVFTAEEGNLLSTAESDTHTVAASSVALRHVVAKPRYGKCSSIVIWMGESAASAVAGFTADSIGLLVGVKGGMGQPPLTNRMVRG